ncbi:MAG: ubiquinol-cytochrome c reductase iron-sulfur subunit [Hyphomicrobiaceae bacterium]
MVKWTVEKSSVNGKQILVDRRTLIVGAAATAIGLPHAVRAETVAPNELFAQAGDRIQIIKGEMKGKLLRPEMLTEAAKPIEAFPFDPKNEVLRRRNRQNRLLVLRLNPDEMEASTRELSVEGVLAYSAICTHRACTIKAWKVEERHLRCHCHLTEFAALTGGTVMTGPAQRQLPMVPLGIDDDGFVIAKGGFTDKPGGKTT